MDFNGYDSTGDVRVQASRTVIGEWRMAAVTLSPTRAKIYADGVDVNAGTPINGWPKIPGALYFGARGEVPDQFFKGWIDEVSWIIHSNFPTPSA